MATTSQNYGLQTCLVFMLFAYSSQLSLSKCPLRLIQNQLIKLYDLCNTSRQFPLECLPEIVDLRFPLEVFKASNERRVIIIKKMLHLLFSFFIKETSNTLNSTCTRNILISLHQQINQLEKCLDPKEMQKEMKDSKHKIYPVYLKVQRYFRRIYDLLQDKEYSPCAWEIVHIEIRNRFVLIIQILQMVIK